MLRYLPFLLLLALTIYAFIDCLNTPEEEVKHLPKGVWVLIILLFSIVGPVVWLSAGKQRTQVGGGSRGVGGGRARRGQWVAPDDNPEFLKSLDQDQDKGDGKGKGNGNGNGNGNGSDEPDKGEPGKGDQA
ncbi:PLD nuclease N-terminal domain-containing protein [Streptomyces sp. RerS4]|uniref:PLD nuclease N-terminal domain-containing protein n=1 Tax=Streptomyces sp. RerS4 TaxID=2942449 RepID=UPI00201BF351|nr:PLD nuclease N-terminal domain-containing protein [Streptomyces sp. RerS4]UQX01606.1 PLD nuclease N-terminal domain-containing protein [Streptomyces sp. RerS4]